MLTSVFNPSRRGLPPKLSSGRHRRRVTTVLAYGSPPAVQDPPDCSSKGCSRRIMFLRKLEVHAASRKERRRRKSSRRLVRNYSCRLPDVFVGFKPSPSRGSIPPLTPARQWSTAERVVVCTAAEGNLRRNNFGGDQPGILLTPARPEAPVATRPPDILCPDCVW